jgi:hypothetical protein
MISYLEEMGQVSKLKAADWAQKIDTLLKQDDLYKRIPYGAKLYIEYLNQ